MVSEEKNKKRGPGLLKIFNDYMMSEYSRPNRITGKAMSKDRYENLKITFNKVKQYIKDKNVKHVNNPGLDFYYKFYKWLEEKDYSINYIGKHISNIKMILGHAFDNKKLFNTEFKSNRFKVFSEESEEIYLSIAELKAIYSLDLSNKGSLYSKVRDLFIIGAYTGLRVSDYKRLSSGNLVEYSGIKMIHVATRKTGTEVIIPIHPYVREIIDSYDGEIPYAHENSINRIIKELGEMAGINDEVSKSITKGGERRKTVYKKYDRIMSHTARRSFCTNAYLAGVDSIDIMAISGHKTEKSFMKYIKVTKQQIALRMAKHPFFNIV